MLGVNLALPQIAAASRPFSPGALFASGEQGVWYDPSDFSTMFQDAAGTTPVTAVEQYVGLVLDKSKGLALGTELVTNGDLSNGTTGWTGVRSALSVVSGELLTTGTSTYPGVYQSFPTTSGRLYRIQFSVPSLGTTTTLRVVAKNGTTDAATDIISADFTTTGSKSMVFFAAGANSVIFFLSQAPVANNTFTIDNISVRELAGNHASQSTSTSRPLLQQDANGCYYLLFDGNDDSLFTASITPGAVDKAQVFAGIRKLSDATTQIIAEWSASATANAGSFYLGVLGNAGFAFNTGGTTQALVTSALSYASPINTVVSALDDISAPLAKLRTNQTSVTNAGAQGTGNFLAYPLYIGRRNNASFPFYGRIYSLVLRFSAANLSDAQIALTESWINGKTKAYTA